MALTTDQIIKILQLKGATLKTAWRICEIAVNENISGDSELSDLILGMNSDKRLPDHPIYSQHDIDLAIGKGTDLLYESEKENIRLISAYDPDYPQVFRYLADRPLLLNVKGDFRNAFKRTGVALVGTRDPTKEGIIAGEFLGEYIGNKGYNVISGLARGCDTAAHRGCLRGHGTTTAIVAHGLDIVYPKENERLAEEIIENGGVLMSEYVIGTGADPDHFKERDRLQAWLAAATILIQSDISGSTMFTVNYTLERCNPLAAVRYKPGIISDEISGNEILIREKKSFALSSANIEEFLKLIR